VSCHCSARRKPADIFLHAVARFLKVLQDEAASGELDMATLARVLDAIREAELQLEPGMWTMLMASIAARAVAGEAELRDGDALLAWLYTVNATAHPPHEWGLECPPRRSSMDWEKALRVNMMEDKEGLRLRNFHELTDVGGNTLRSVLEEKLGVVAGCALHGRADMADGWAVLEEMQAWGIPPDVETYTLLLCVAAGAARHGTQSYSSARSTRCTVVLSERAVLAGRASLRDADVVLAEMEESGLEPHALTFGAWVDVVAGAALRGGATWREGQAVIECELRLGIRPDNVQFVHLLAAVANQAEAGVPSPRAPGNYTYDPIADAEEALAMLARVEPRLYPAPPHLAQYLRAVRAAAARGLAGASEVRRVEQLHAETIASLMPTGLAEGSFTREEHWARGSFVARGPDETWFNDLLAALAAAVSSRPRERECGAMTRACFVMFGSQALRARRPGAVGARRVTGRAARHRQYGGCGDSPRLPHTRAPPPLLSEPSPSAFSTGQHRKHAQSCGRGAGRPAQIRLTSSELSRSCCWSLWCYQKRRRRLRAAARQKQGPVALRRSPTSCGALRSFLAPEITNEPESIFHLTQASQSVPGAPGVRLRAGGGAGTRGARSTIWMSTCRGSSSGCASSASRNASRT
jgi:hypothetical protein